MPPPPPPPPRASGGDTVFRWVSQSAGVFVLAVAGALLAVLVIESWPFLTGPHRGELLTSDEWEQGGRRTSYGALVFVYGTLATSLIAMLVAVPLGVGAAAFLSEIAPAWARTTCGFLLELLAAVPSIVYGFWGKEFLAGNVLRPIFDSLGLDGQLYAQGQGVLAAGLVLAVMILPYITAVSFDVCRAVPRSQREAALAVGATRWQTIWKVVLPFARPGILAACFLALGRALGETMAVTMVIGNGDYLPHFAADYLSGTGDTIPSKIAKQLHETTPANVQHRSALVTLGLLLLGITLVMNLLARLLIGWATKPRVKGDRKAIQLSGELVEVPSPPPDVVAAALRRAARTDRIMTALLTAAQILTIVPLFLILGYVAYQGAGRVTTALFTNLPYAAVPGLGNAMLGSLMLVGLASLFAIPLGLATAVFLSEHRMHRLAKPVRFVAELLGGVPSIVIGVFAYSLLCRPLWASPQASTAFSGWAGAFALGVMMLPVLIRSAEEALRLVPRGLREASYALGATRWQTVSRVIFPAALPAIITGVLLAVGRIGGETAPLILTAGSTNNWPQSPGSPTPALPTFIYKFIQDPSRGDKDTDLAWAGAFVLLTVVLALNIGTRLLAGKRVVAASAD